MISSLVNCFAVSRTLLGSDIFRQTVRTLLGGILGTFPVITFHENEHLKALNLLYLFRLREPRGSFAEMTILGSSNSSHRQDPFEKLPFVEPITYHFLK